MAASENAYPDENGRPHPATLSSETYHVPVGFSGSEYGDTPIDVHRETAERERARLATKQAMDHFDPNDGPGDSHN